ncbi:hypothetical protein HOLleu_11336 [Holothuria leucospilota]|uniref:Uncharacterized protein n=1 Tax=Holothuria leucospilota TaxID=206669 RepID=A0A9Q1CF39_HOLLE|nr:hypothetical protein HOLleu_11336 [Holothuria leucospilota]
MQETISFLKNKISELRSYIAQLWRTAKSNVSLEQVSTLSLKLKEHKKVVRTSMAKKKQHKLAKLCKQYKVDITLPRKRKRLRKRSFKQCRTGTSQNVNVSVTDSETGVFNVSDLTLTKTEESLLSKGLKFCPTPLALDKLSLQKDLDAFKRRLRLFEYFNAGIDKTSDTHGTEVQKIKNKSTWTPREGRDKFLDCFLEAVQKDIDSFQPSKYVKDNLSKVEREALRNLKNNENIVIKPEDKGPAFVTQNTSTYVHTAMLDLNNKKVYRINEYDKTTETVEHVNRIAATMLKEGDIDSSTAEYLTSGEVKTSRYYTLPKTHKDKDEDGNLKTRPVISGNGSPIERLSEFVDFYINPEMRKLPSFVKDSKDILLKINSINNKGPLNIHWAMFTIDVKAIYPSMPQRLGLEGVRRALEATILDKNTWDSTPAPPFNVEFL